MREPPEMPIFIFFTFSQLIARLYGLDRNSTWISQGSDLLRTRTQHATRHISSILPGSLPQWSPRIISTNRGSGLDYAAR
ncbi:hypothetical protein EDB83DRAFT_1957979 [Lactarius deliciosus]|nr:hypothetical protein EDB83DRAFT_1957979 [Lactarius deliciosus]